MSCSSSTTRISSAMCSTVHCSVFRMNAAPSAQAGERLGVENEPDERAPLPSVLELDRPEMLLDDLLDDREPQAGALCPRRHIGLGQSSPVGRSADACIADLDADLPICLADPHGEPVALAKVGRA